MIATLWSSRSLKRVTFLGTIQRMCIGSEKSAMEFAQGQLERRLCTEKFLARLGHDQANALP